MTSARHNNNMLMDGQIKLREKVGYGLGDAASSMFWKLFGSYLLFFYTDIFGLPAVAVGTMFLITRFWDSFVDPVVGIIADRTQSRRGKFRPYLLWFAVPFGVAGVLTFTTPGFGMTGKLVYAYITYGLMMMIYSFINVPYASLLGVISDNPRSRTELSSYRMLFAFGGSILALLTIEPLVGWFSRGSDPQTGWQAATTVLAAVAIVFFFCTYSWTRERVQPVHTERHPLREDLKDLLRNRPWWILLGAGDRGADFQFAPRRGGGLLLQILRAGRNCRRHRRHLVTHHNLPRTGTGSQHCGHPARNSGFQPHRQKEHLFRGDGCSDGIERGLLAAGGA